jgi:hypothetical protein
MTFLFKSKISILVIVLGALFCINVFAETLNKINDIGMNANQPFSQGDWVDKSYGIIKRIDGGSEYWTIIYRGVEDNNVIVELIGEIKDSAYGDNGIKTKLFKLPLDANKQTFLNVLSNESTYLLTVIDNKNHITLQETKTHKNVPVRVISDIQQPVVRQSNDFDMVIGK